MRVVYADESEAREAPLRRDEKKKITGTSATLGEIEKTATGIRIKNTKQAAYLITREDAKLTVTPSVEADNEVMIKPSAEYARLICLSRSTHLLLRTLSGNTSPEVWLQQRLLTAKPWPLTADEIQPELAQLLQGATGGRVGLTEVDCTLLKGKAFVLEGDGCDTAATPPPASPVTLIPVSGPMPPPVSLRLPVSQPASSLFRPHDTSRQRVPVTMRPKATPASVPPSLQLTILTGGLQRGHAPPTPRAEVTPRHVEPVSPPSAAGSPTPKSSSALLMRQLAVSPPPQSRGLFRAVGVVAAFAGAVFLARHNKTSAKVAARGVASSMRP